MLKDGSRVFIGKQPRRVSFMNLFIFYDFKDTRYR